MLRRAMLFLPSLDAFAPHLVEEVQGIADGARVSFAEVLLVNVRAEIMGIGNSDALCTAFAVGRSATASRTVLSGQNLDQHPANRDLLIMLKVTPDTGPPILMCTFGGLVGYPGINANGVSVFQNALSTSSWRRQAMPHYFLKRALLEQPDVTAAVRLFRSAEVCSSNNYVLTDGDGMLCDVEVTPDGSASLDVVGDLLVHTNHFRDPALSERDLLLASLPDSALRAPRMHNLLDQQRGRITVDSLKSALADHTGAPAGICRHQENVVTIASIIAEPEEGRLHVAAGNPCGTDFVTYTL
jgi:isopenicillin-N N-acyltransferase like protein